MYNTSHPCNKIWQTRTDSWSQLCDLLSEIFYLSSRSYCPPREVIGLPHCPVSPLSGWSEGVWLRHRWGIVGVLTNIPPNNNLSRTNTHIHRPHAKHFLWKDELHFVRTIYQAVKALKVQNRIRWTNIISFTTLSNQEKKGEKSHALAFVNNYSSAKCVVQSLHGRFIAPYLLFGSPRTTSKMLTYGSSCAVHKAWLRPDHNKQ